MVIGLGLGLSLAFVVSEVVTEANFIQLNKYDQIYKLSPILTHAL